MTNQRIALTHRIIKPGDRGPDVQALKRALADAKLFPWPGDHPDPHYGPIAQAAVKKFQAQHHLDQDAEVGPKTLIALLPHFDRFGLHLLAQGQPAAGGGGTRHAVVAAALLAYNKRDQIHYTEDMKRRMEGVVKRIKPPNVPSVGDCSSMVTWYYFAAGAPDPNGAGYNGSGFTGTLDRGRTVSIDQSQPGDYVLYGTAHPWAHVALFVGEKQGQHMVVSHGSEGGPYYLPWNYRKDTGPIKSLL